MNPSTTTRVDLHCHSTASEISKLGVQRSLGLPECATPPDEVYELAKRRGMDFVTITDHDTIDGCLEIADRPDVFISEELTAWFRDEPQAVHVLCFGITPDQHEWLQENSGDLEECAEYLHSNGVACSLAHPFYAVEAPLTPAHRRRLAQLFPVWETRNGSRARELNQPAAIYIETQGGTGTGGSDDHAGVDIGRTYTETPPASAPEEFLAHIRAGRAEPKGEQGGFAKWAHAAMALATRAHLEVLGNEGDREASPDAVLKMAARVMSEGDLRRGSAAGDLTPEDGRALLDAFTDSVGLGLSGRALIEYLQAEDFDHKQLAKHARRVHESRLGVVIDKVEERIGSDPKPEELPGMALETGRELFQAAVPAIPYAPAAAFLEREKAKLNPHDGATRVALVADGIGAVHGVTRTIEKIRELGVPGHEVEVIGTDRGVDRRLPAVRDLEAPFYRGLELGVPSLPAMVEVLSENHYDLIHLTSPGPANVIAALLAKVMDVPVVGSFHTEFGAYAGMRQGAEQAKAVANAALSLFYGQCDHVLSPSPATDNSLAAMGIDRSRIGRWGRGVDTSRFDPALADPQAFPGEIKVLYAGRLSREKGIDLLADAFLEARVTDPRLHLLLAGGGPEEEWLRERLGDSATFLGWLEGDELPRAYASADIFMFCSRTDTFGQVLVEAGASGLPVIAVNEGGPTSIVVEGGTGRLCPPEPQALAAALLQMAGAPSWRRTLGLRGLAAARTRTWRSSIAELAAGYRAAAPPRSDESHDTVESLAA